uniref:EF-hand domain-containing protein n=1 Tax=Clastoptera arizonana TaxID=38151 RepID=A0A1B6DL25_9HEMI
MATLSSATMEENEDKMRALRRAFLMADSAKTGFIESNKIASILSDCGHSFDEKRLNRILRDVDTEKTGKISLDDFSEIVSVFVEEESAEAMQQELKEAFRLYDKEGNGFITTKVLREILAALDDNLTSADLDGMIEEIDSDDSGTVDFEEFMEMMTGE